MARYRQRNILISVYYCDLLNQVNLSLHIRAEGRHLNCQQLALFDAEAQAAEQIGHRRSIKTGAQEGVAPGRPQLEAFGGKILRLDINNSLSNLAASSCHYQLGGAGQRR